MLDPFKATLFNPCNHYFHFTVGEMEAQKRFRDSFQVREVECSPPGIFRYCLLDSVTSPLGGVAEVPGVTPVFTVRTLRPGKLNQEAPHSGWGLLSAVPGLREPSPGPRRLVLTNALHCPH